jgi:hypothetical protein
VRGEVDERARRRSAIVALVSTETFPQDRSFVGALDTLLAESGGLADRLVLRRRRRDSPAAHQLSAAAGSGPTLAFGGRSIHLCLGAGLGRLEATIAVQRVAARFPHLTMPEQQIPFHPNISFRGPQRLLVETGTPGSLAAR